MKGGYRMLGIEDGWIALAFLLCLLSALLCVVYGLVNWNKGMETETAEVREEAAWEKTEHEINDDQ